MPGPAPKTRAGSALSFGASAGLNWTSARAAVPFRQDIGAARERDPRHHSDRDCLEARACATRSDLGVLQDVDVLRELGPGDLAVTVLVR